MSYDSEVLADSPLVYLILDEASGTAMADSSGNGRTATKAGSPAMHQTKVMPTGTFSIELNATTELVSIADAAWMDAASFSVTSWVKCATVTSLHAVIGRDGTAGARGWTLYVRDGQVQYYDAGAGFTVTGGTVGAAAAVHVGMTYDAPSHTTVVYLNGVAVATDTTHSAGTTLANALRVGTSLAGTAINSFTLNGNVERAAMFGTALSAARILAHYQAGISTYVGTAAPTVTISAASALRLGISGTATPALTVTATSAGVRGKTGTATRTVAISAASALQLGVSGNATPALTVAASSAGVRGKVGTAAAALAIAAVSAGVVTTGTTGDTTPHLTISATSAAALGVTGQATPTLAVAASSAGVRGKTGAAAPTVTISAASALRLGVHGHATPSLTVAASSAGDLNLAPTGVATPTLAFTVQAAGVVVSIPRTIIDWSGGGRVRDGIAVAAWEPPVIALPPDAVTDDMVARVIDAWDVNEATGAVTLTQRTLRAPRAFYRIKVGGKDVTVWRGSPTPPLTFTLLQPLMYGSGRLTLPQVDAIFESPGHGALRFLAKHNRVVQQRVDPDTHAILGTDYIGFISDYDLDGPNFSCTLGGEATARLELALRPPTPFPRIIDIGRLLVAQIRRRAHLAANDPPTTGVRASEGGTGGSELDFLMDLTAKSTMRDGTQWTVMPDATGTYTVQPKDGETVDFTLYLDDELAIPSLRRDFAVEPDVVWATGIAPDGRRITNTVLPGLATGPRPRYPMDDHSAVLHPGDTDADTDTGNGITRMIWRLWNANRLPAPIPSFTWTTDDDDPVTDALRELQDDADLHVTGNLNLATWRALYDMGVNQYSLRGARVLPFAKRGWVTKYRINASGQRIGRNPRYVRSNVPVHAAYDMGPGHTEPQIQKWSRQQLGPEVNLIGSVTVAGLAVIRGLHNPGDPFDESMLMDAREVRPGMNGWYPNLRPTADSVGTLLHTVAVDEDESGTPRLTVDSRMRDALAAWEQIARNRESRRTPARLYIAQNRSSNQIKDAGALWDRAGGRIAPLDVEGRTWTYFEVPAGREGSARNLTMQTDPPAEFAVAFFGHSVHQSVMDNRIGDPLTADGRRAWRRHHHLLRRRYWLNYSAGTEDNPCGYSPSTKPDVMQDLPWRVTFADGHYLIFESEARANQAAEGHPGANVGQFGDPTDYLTGEWEDDMTWPYFCVGEPVLRGFIFTSRTTTLQGGRIMTLLMDDQV